MNPRSLPFLRAAAPLAAAALLSCGRERPVDAGSLVAARTLGLAYLQMDQLADAETQFKRVIAIAPGEALGHANLALTYLRGGRLVEAEAEARRALALDSTSASIALTAAGVYAAQGRPAEARAVLEPRTAGDDPAVLFALAQLDSSAAATESRLGLLRRIIAKSPTNIAVRFAQLDAFASRGLADSAARAIEEIRRIRPEPPREALGPYGVALPLLRAGKLAEARASLAQFRAAMELTPAYQSALSAVKGPNGPMVGRPALTFSPRLDIAQRVTSLGKAVDDAVRLADVTADLKLPAAGAGAPATGASTVAAGDFDGDGDDDLFVSAWDASAQAFTPRLYVARNGAFEDVTKAARLDLPGGATFAMWADYDNDGHLDLFAIGADGRGRLFRNTGRQRFEDVTARARVSDVGGATTATFVDIDHDGDLDIVAVGPGGLRALQNHGDGTFSDETAAYGLHVAAPPTPGGGTYDIAFADFDGDGRTDLLVSRGAAGLTLFRNVGARRFEDATAAAGLVNAGAAGAIAVGDYDNDGAFDIIVAPPGGGEPVAWRNRGNATFTRDARRGSSLAALRQIAVSSLQFTDYDNDGWLDIVAVGKPDKAGGAAAGNAFTGSGLRIFRNDGKTAFEDRSSLVPPGIAATSLAISDFDNDGDADFVTADAATGPRAIRNVGGNANLYVQVRLSALRTGSGKNNDFGIGSKLELRVGDVVQTRTVTSPVTRFGLGTRLKADVLRVEWTNGVPEVIFFPGSDQDVLENEILKGSCAFLYAWNGERFEFVTDVMWRSALGMPMGLMAGGTAWAPAGASQEYLRIPGSLLQARNGQYVLQFTEELWETAYADQLRLIAVDHPDSATVHVDERFVPPGPAVTPRLFMATQRHPPVSAVDERGRDVLPAIRDKDDIYVSNLVATEFQGIVEPHELVMDLGPDAGAHGTALYLRGWIYPTDASINVALSQQTRIKPAMPVLEVRDASGAWKPAADIGFPSGKDKTIVVDLAGKFPTRDHHVRIRTNMQIYWDQAFVATEAPESPVKMTELTLQSADLHYRGASEMHRKGGRYGPQWFDYDKVTRDPAWRPITGRFTRFGDVLPLLRASDDMFVVMAPGDEVTLRFDATIPPPPSGWTRDFLLFSDGWIKDSDLNTALGTTSDPLPFHAIKEYPYAPGEKYPDDAVHRRYLRQYHTRVIGRR